MRKNEFRVWDETDKTMLYFEGIFNQAPYTEHSTQIQMDSFKEYHTYVEMMYSGVNHNLQKIYEGDVLETISSILNKVKTNNEE